MIEAQAAAEATRPCHVWTEAFSEDCYANAGHLEECVTCQSDFLTRLEASRRHEARKERLRIEQEQVFLQDRKDHPEKWLPELGVPKKHLGVSFESFRGGEAIKRVCKEAIENQSSLFLSGQTGSGKTHLAVAMIRAMVQTTKELQAKFVPAPELLLRIRSTFNGDQEKETEVIAEYSSVPILVLDDLGAESRSEWTEATLYLLLDRRNRDEKQTIVTTNLSLADIQERLGARIASRLHDMRIIKLNLPDYRKKGAVV
jgi:DNA replication protein DnaC